ncbi:MAG: hypothetical protein MJZ74_11135, partial [Muribaculaceae bacterium]|nr:hypothetical protein [Muribaculaceae bacterium]
MNTPFLTQVAAHYASSPTLHDTLFVLPNRRSTKQFERALAQQLTTTSIMPRLMSMNDFVDHVTRGSNLVIAPPIENLFVAYGAYKEVMGENAGEFDKFAYWGQLIVSDFNDVDMNLVNASSLYTNLSNLREISANYIDDDLKLAISRIFNINLNDGADKFWKSNGNEVHEKYVTLWNRLAAIYDKYGEMLAGYHLTTQGKLYRLAAQALEHMGAADLGFSLVVMVGHDMLSMSEMRMFKLLQKKGLAHFWWDDASPAFVSDANPAARVIKALSQAFKAPAQLEPIDNLPAVTVQSVPSTMGQAKCAFEGLTALTADTAIVLPDESMLEPLLHSLPDELLAQDGGTVNVTMGYQLRQSNVVTLMRLVTIAHHHAVRKADRWYFYREDVRNILSHPIIKMAFTATVLAVNNAIEEQNEYNIPASMFSGTGLEPLFTAFGTQPQAVGDNMGLAPLKASADVMSFVDGLERFCDT